LIKLLTYFGALPFFLAIYIGFSNDAFFGIDGSRWFLSYGLVILNFMAGTLWGQVVNESIKVKRIALAANAITLVAWFAFLLADPSIVLIVLALGFVALYVLERFVMNPMKRPDYYLGLRLRVTALVVVAHGVMFCQV
jgi:prolipoprotein diacylglyceryltransferase